MLTVKYEFISRFPGLSEESQKEEFWIHLQNFYEFLILKNHEGGFFSKSDSDLILERHIMDSYFFAAKVLDVLRVSRETEFADVGTGPGLPGYLFFLIGKFKSVSFIDSQKRKMKHLEEFARNQKLPGEPRFIYDRAENVKKKFDLVSMRAAIPYPWSVEVCSGLVKQGGCFVPYLRKLKNLDRIEGEILERMGFDKQSEFSIPELNFLGERNVKVLKKRVQKETGKARLWKVIQKEIREYNG